MSNPAEQAAEPGLLKLAVLDSEDLGVISAHLQDATVRVGDMAYLPKARRFALVASRFDWMLARRGSQHRCMAGLHFEHVRRVTRIGFDQRPDLVLKMLAVTFIPDQAPSGMVVVAFADGAALRLEVECLEAALSDMGPRRPVDNGDEMRNG